MIVSLENKEFLRIPNIENLPWTIFKHMLILIFKVHSLIYKHLKFKNNFLSKTNNNSLCSSKKEISDKNSFQNVWIDRGTQCENYLFRTLKNSTNIYSLKKNTELEDFNDQRVYR